MFCPVSEFKNSCCTSRTTLYFFARKLHVCNVTHSKFTSFLVVTKLGIFLDFNGKISSPRLGIGAKVWIRAHLRILLRLDGISDKHTHTAIGSYMKQNLDRPLSRAFFSLSDISNICPILPSAFNNISKQQGNVIVRLNASLAQWTYCRRTKLTLSSNWKSKLI